MRQCANELNTCFLLTLRPNQPTSQGYPSHHTNMAVLKFITRNRILPVTLTTRTHTRAQLLIFFAHSRYNLDGLCRNNSIYDIPSTRRFSSFPRLGLCPLLLSKIRRISLTTLVDGNEPEGSFYLTYYCEASVNATTANVTQNSNVLQLNETAKVIPSTTPGGYRRHFNPPRF